MPRAAVGTEGRREDVGWSEGERVRAGPVPVGDDQDRARGAADVGVELLDVQHRAVDREHRDPLGAGGHRRARPGRRGLRVTFVAFLLEDPVLEPSALAGHRGIGGDDENVIEGTAAGQLHDQVEEEGLGESVALLLGQHAVQAPVGAGEPLHRNDRGRMQVCESRPHRESGYRVRRPIPAKWALYSFPLTLDANSRVRSASRRLPSRPSISVGQLSVSMPSGGGSGSSSSQIIASISPSYSDATPAAVTGRPTARMKMSVGPLTTRPATNGLTATTGAADAAIASRSAEIARIGPIEITGFDGPITIASAGPIAAITSGVGLASPIPSTSIASTGASPCSATRYCCRSRQSSAVRTRVRTRSSHIGRTAASTPSARAIWACAAVRVPPSETNTRRYRQVARARSERRNQSGVPSLTSRSKTVNESPLMPQPRSSSISPPSQ